MKAYRAVGGLILFCIVFYVFSCAGQTWTKTSAPDANWEAVCCSADGHVLTAAGWLTNSSGWFSAGAIYRSTNSGATWYPVEAPSQQWAAIACSADGERLIAAAVRGNVYLSTNSGLSWLSASTPPGQEWSAVCSSADGAVLGATIYRTGGGMFCGAAYTSTNGGLTWESNVSSCFSCIRSSADGSRLLAGGCYGSHWGAPNVYASSNAGKTWEPTTAPCPLSVAASADGTKFYSAGWEVAVSSDSGVAWSYTPWPYGVRAQAIACSADGRKIAAVSRAYPQYYTPGYILTSGDSGATWVSNTAPSEAWTSVASSADGAKLVAVAEGGGIYTLQTTPCPVLNISQSGDSLLLAWVTPSMEFRVQQSADLTNWSEVWATPVLNNANLRQEVSVPGGTGTRFYRLATP